jgi:tetratricopeptide (TPR) repeat protein
MTTNFRCCAALLLAALTATPAIAAEECSLPRVASIELISGPTEVPAIAGSIDGKLAHFDVDTGAVWSLLDSQLSAGLTTKPLPDGMYFMDAADAKTTMAVTAKELAFGPFKLNKVDFLKSEATTLGANILKIFDVEIDPVEHKLNLFKHKPCDGSAAYWPHSDLVILPFRDRRDGWITFNVKLDGERLEAMLDTGAAMSDLDDRAARNSFDINVGDAGTQASGTARSATGQLIQQYRHQFKMLEIGDIQIGHPSLRIGGHGHDFWHQGVAPPLILGMQTLAPFHVYIAYQEHRLYLTTMQGDLAAGRKPPEGVPTGDNLAAVNIRELLESAAQALKAGDSDRAHAYLDKAVGTDPNNPDALAARAYFLASRHDNAGAKADFDRLDALPLGSVRDYVRRSAANLKAKRFDRALDDAETVVRRWPASSEALNQRCWVRAITGRLDAALADCNAALALTPNAGFILDSRGFVHLKAGRLDAAIADYDAALARQPRSASSLYGRGLAKRQNGDGGGADADQAAARAIDPNIDTRFGT